MIISSILKVLKVSVIMAVITNVLNVTLFSLYPQYLAKEKKSITILESEFFSGILNIKNLLYYFVIWIITAGIYYLAARLGLVKLYRTIVLVVILAILIISSTSIGYSLHLLGYVLFIIFSTFAFLSFYLLIENEISKAHLE